MKESKVDLDVLIGFVEEAKGYLPAILQGIRLYGEDPDRREGLKEAHRHMHTIKGASAMVGLSALSHLAYRIEELLEETLDGQLSLGSEDGELLCDAVSLVDQYLDHLPGDSFDEQSLLAEATRIHHQIKGLDEGALGESETLIADQSLAESIGKGDETWLPIDEAVMRVEEEISPELMEAFTLEAEDHLRNLSSQLAEFDKSPDNKELLQDIRRVVHTLKGASGAVSLQQVTRMTHRMEDLLDRFYDGSLEPRRDTMDLLFASSDAIEDLVTGMMAEGHKQPSLQPLYDGYSVVLDTADSSSIASAGDEPTIVKTGLVTGFSHPPSPQVFPEQPNLARKPGTSKLRKPGEIIRVPLDRLDELVRLVSELVISRTAFEQRMTNFSREVDELRLSGERLLRVTSNLETKYEVTALGGKLLFTGDSGDGKSKVEATRVGVLGFDDLEFDRYTDFHLLSRELVEATSDIRTIGNELGTLVGDFDSILSRQGRLSSEIQTRLMQTRMLPLATLATRLHRAVRVLAREQGKLVDLVLEGEEIELDKTVLEEMTDPLIHLLRNAVDHGIEAPELRKAIGKAERGVIKLSASHEGNQVIIRVGDDGSGLQSDLLSSMAIRMGHLTEPEAQNLSPQDLESLIFLPGFSTAVDVNEVSGRGIGLDIVRTKVRKMKGSVSIDSETGVGTSFVIRLPMTLAVMKALMVKAHGETLAVPSSAILQILRLEKEEIERIGQEQVIKVGEEVYPLVRLGDALGLESIADDQTDILPVMIISTGAEKIALVVDHVLGGSEIVIKSLGNHLRRVQGVAGATLMGDGSVVLILNPSDLMIQTSDAEFQVGAPVRNPNAAIKESLSVMIVDDSLSVRRVVSSLISSAGWEAITAKDGIEALEILQRSALPPDLILVDIEMPRMDGYELMSSLKAHAAYGQVPLVVLSSRASDKHRRKALDVGASDYIVKPYQDHVLLNVIRRLVRLSRETVPA